jgi:hypothetical protein
MTAYALDHGGKFPPDLSALLSGANYGFPVDKAGEWLGPVVEYRGRKLTQNDKGRLLLMRYRIDGSSDTEVRAFVTGTVRPCPIDEPIPEDNEPAPSPDAPPVPPQQ